MGSRRSREVSPWLDVVCGCGQCQTELVNSKEPPLPLLPSLLVLHCVGSTGRQGHQRVGGGMTERLGSENITKSPSHAWVGRERAWAKQVREGLKINLNGPAEGKWMASTPMEKVRGLKLLGKSTGVFLYQWHRKELRVEIQRW